MLRAQLKEAAAVTEAEAIPVSERPALIAKIEKQLKALEYEECALVAAIRASGGKADYRPDARPEAVLGVEVVIPPRPAKTGAGSLVIDVFEPGRKRPMPSAPPDHDDFG